MTLLYDEMAGAWVADQRSTAIAILEHPALHARPAHYFVPEHLKGTPLELHFRRLIRMNDGPLHNRLKPLIADIIEEVERKPGMLIESVRSLEDALFEVTLRALAAAIGLRGGALDAAPAQGRGFARALAPDAGSEEAQSAAAGVEQLDAALEPLWSDPDVRSNLLGLFFQTAKAAASLIRACILQLRAETAEHADTLVRDADRLRAYVDEVARTRAPIQSTRRWAAEEVIIEGCTVRCGDCVIVDLAAAGLSFGTGLHACPGSLLAVRLCAEAITALTRSVSLHDLPVFA